MEKMGHFSEMMDEISNLRSSLQAYVDDNDLLRARVAELEELLRGVGANRYWEGRWRDEAKRVAELEGALDTVMVGGNHIASVLIHRMGADFCNRFPPDADPHSVLESTSSVFNYYVWCCWSAIMRARAVLNAPANGREVSANQPEPTRTIGTSGPDNATPRPAQSPAGAVDVRCAHCGRPWSVEHMNCGVIIRSLKEGTTGTMSKAVQEANTRRIARSEWNPSGRAEATDEKGHTYARHPNGHWSYRAPSGGLWSPVEEQDVPQIFRDAIRRLGRNQ